MKFIGRDNKLNDLQGLWSKKGSSLVVCWGRRRIGKSTLIQEFAKRSKVQFLEVQGLAPAHGIAPQMQVDHFMKTISGQLNLPTMKVEGWQDAFDFLVTQIKPQEKTILFLDEISWMASGNEQFLSHLKIAWDTKLSKFPKLILVLCGSVSSWINDHILKHTSFLGRISMDLHLQELTLPECHDWFKEIKLKGTYAEWLNLLSITGGVPKYLAEINPRQTIDENIQRLCFEPTGFLFNEFDKIFVDIFDKRAHTYKKIIQILVNQSCSYQDICKKMGKEKSGVILNYLEELSMAGFLSRDWTYKYDGKVSKLSKFRLRDNYLRFYLKYIEPSKNKVKSGIKKDFRLEGLSQWSIISGLQFENLILSNLPFLLDKLKIPPEIVESASPFFQSKTTKNKGACQIDCLIHTRFNNLFICEFKMRKHVDINVVNEVKRKEKVLVHPKQLSTVPILICAGELGPGIEDAEYFSKIITESDLFS